MQPVERAPRFRLEGKAELGGEADGAEQPQRVLRKARFRIADAAQQAVPQVLPPAERVDETIRFAVGHRVDRKVAPGEVLLDRGGERYAVGPSAVRIAAVDAERRDFIRLAVEQHGHGAVADAGFDDREVPENGLRFRGARVGRNVPVVRRAAEQAVAHAAAYGIGAMPGVRQARQNRPAGVGQLNLNLHGDHIVSESWRSFTPRRSPCCATRSRT